MKILILLLVTLSATGQNHDEWFRQKETQRKYLTEQIAAFKLYFDHAKKGYEIAENGLRVVRDIKDGDLDLHRAFLHSLQRINPAIKDYARVADIISLQVNIIKNAKEAIEGAKEMKVFTKGEIEYCAKVSHHLLTSCLDNIGELIVLISDGRYEMKDDERLKRVDLLYADMQDKAAFSSNFSEELALLAVQRMRELKEVDISKILSGLK